MRAALYARFSTGNQNPLSVDDQLALCQRYATSIGAHVVREFTDPGISGEAIANRPGLRALLAFAEAGGCDMVIAEHTDRLGRAGSAGWVVFENLRTFGVTYSTVNQQEVTATDQAVSSLVSVLQLEEGRKKTRRGQEGRVRAGRAMDSVAYGYEAVIKLDDRGERVRGLRQVCPAEAAVVLRIFEAYAAGQSPRAIAEALNADGIRGPRGGAWHRSTIQGDPAKGVGILNNETYRGVRHWGRRAVVKDHRSGRRLARMSKGEILRFEVPELRIVPEILWQRTRAQLAASAIGPAGEGRGQRRPKTLLSGLLRCGVCGGKMNRTGAGDGLRCATRIEQGPSACTNNRKPGYAILEARVLASLRANLLHPKVLAEAAAVAAAVEAEERRAQVGARSGRERELADVSRRAERLIDQVADGHLTGLTVKDKLAQLEARKAELTIQLRDLGHGPKVVTLHPAPLKYYLDLVETLHSALSDAAAEDTEGRQALRSLIDEVRFMPKPARGEYELEIDGQLEPLLSLNTAEPVRVLKTGSCFGHPHRTIKFAG